MSIVTCTDCWDGIPNDSMWQYLDNAEQLLSINMVVTHLYR